MEQYFLQHKALVRHLYGDKTHKRILGNLVQTTYQNSHWPLTAVLTCTRLL